MSAETAQRSATLALALERAAMRAWPALECIEEAGWRLRFANGYTKRANCATALDATDVDLEDRIAWCARQFAARKLPAVFRVLSSCGPARLDHALATAGYRRADESLVMVLDLPSSCEPAGAGAPRARDEAALRPAIKPLSLDSWLDLFDRFAGKDGEQRTMHRAMLETIPGERLLATVDADGQSVGCGLCVRDGQFVGLFDLAVAPQLRGRGHGRRLLDGMLCWAAARGARRSYLQVLAANQAAVRLYQHAGFREAYRYWYRLPPESLLTGG